jgi:hypothetical protein
MVGIILSVRPCDAKENYSSDFRMHYRGARHEAIVLASPHLGEPTTPIHHAIIPPSAHSGIDNYAEDLPRGCSQLVDGDDFDTSFQNVDYTKLDGEWCVLGFIGGRVEYPVIIAWWPHPSNNFDLMTSGRGNDERTFAQYDLKKNRGRKLTRINGIEIVVNKDGSVYLDTNQAGRSVVLGKDGVPQAKQVAKGGHIQVDVKQTAQFELNWNAKELTGARIGAGSSAQTPVHDPDLPHHDQPISNTTPKARETTRTYIRGKEYELLLKTSALQVFCSKEGSTNGDCVVVATDQILLAQQSGSGAAATLSIQGGQLQLVTDDGTAVNVLHDEVQLVTKSGGLVDLKGNNLTVAGKVDVSGPLAVGGPGPLAQPMILGDTFLAALDVFLKVAGPAFEALSAASVGPLAALKTQFTALSTAANVFKAAATLTKAKNLTSS